MKAGEPFDVNRLSFVLEALGWKLRIEGNTADTDIWKKWTSFFHINCWFILVSQIHPETHYHSRHMDAQWTPTWSSIKAGVRTLCRNLLKPHFCHGAKSSRQIRLSSWRKRYWILTFIGWNLFFVRGGRRFWDCLILFLHGNVVFRTEGRERRRQDPCEIGEATGGKGVVGRHFLIEFQR